MPHNVIAPLPIRQESLESRGSLLILGPDCLARVEHHPQFVNVPLDMLRHPRNAGDAANDREIVRKTYRVNLLVSESNQQKEAKQSSIGLKGHPCNKPPVAFSGWE